ncbi:hypothetical protein EGW08_014540 [Elysia chlorotica]|uniref:G-protein coupled receptors family 1 profile domain-containing protein n=1 Tax=Elysia chlorotica TaxID=188477 RepID=A0A3S0ZLK2_ELYCH|nr:hypothetical protein EGW08_014540 [Elysia chlorotica]
MNVSTDTPQGFSPRDVLPVDAHSHLRNRIVGSIGILSSIAALLLLWQSSRIRPPLKLVVISMSLCNLFTMTVAAVWGPHLPCWPALFFLSGTILISYFMTTLLAFHNYVAVFFLANCHQLLGFGRTAIIVTLCWVGGHLIILACLGGIHIPRGASCYVTAVMSREGLAAVSIICLLCCFLTIFMNLRVVMRIRRRPEHRALKVPVSAMTQDRSNSRDAMSTRAYIASRFRKRPTSSVTPTPCFALSLARLSEFCLPRKLPDLLETKCKRENKEWPQRVSSLEKSSQEAHTLSQTQTTSDLPEGNNLITAIAVPNVFNTDCKLPHQNLSENGPFHKIGSSHSDLITAGYHELKSASFRDSETSQSSNLCDTMQQQQPCSEAPSLFFPQNAGGAASWSNDTKEKKCMTIAEIESSTYSEVIAISCSNELDESDKLTPFEKTQRHKVIANAANNTIQFESEVFCTRQPNGTSRSKPEPGDTKEELFRNISPRKIQSVASRTIDTHSKKCQCHAVFSVSEQASCSSDARVLSRRHSTRCGRVCKNHALGLSRAYSAKSLRGNSNSSRVSQEEAGTYTLIQYKDTFISVGKGGKGDGEKLPQVTTNSQYSKSHQQNLKVACPGRVGSVAIYNSFGFSNGPRKGVISQDGHTILQENTPQERWNDPEISCNHPSPNLRAHDYEQSRNLIKGYGTDISTACLDKTEQSIPPTVRINRETSFAPHPKTALKRPTSFICNSVSSSKSEAKKWRRRTKNTLLILCSWSCFLSLPYVFYGGYVAIWIEDRASFSASGFGKLLSALALFNSISTPLLYAWRLVDWHPIWFSWRKKLAGCMSLRFKTSAGR